MTDITSTSAWKNLEQLHAEKSQTTLRDLFAADSERAQTLSFSAAGLHVDMSKQLIDADVLEALTQLADEAGLAEKIEAMFGGAHINNTEDLSLIQI